MLLLFAFVSCAHQRPPLAGDVAVGRYVDPARHFTFRLPAYAGGESLVDRVMGSEGQLGIGGFFGVQRSLAWSSHSGHGPVLPAETIEAWSESVEDLAVDYGVERTRVSSGPLPSEHGDYYHEIWEVRYEGRFASNKVLLGFVLCASPKTVVWLGHSMVLWNSNWLKEERLASSEDLEKEREALTDLIERVSFDDPLLDEFREQHVTPIKSPRE